MESRRRLRIRVTVRAFDRGESDVRTDRKGLSRAPTDRPSALRVTWRRTLEFRRFLAAGSATTLLDYVLFIALTRILGLSLDWVWAAKLISGTVAISISFYLNRTWVFRAAGGSLGQAVRFATTMVVGVYVIQTPLTQIFASSFPDPGEALYDALARIGLSDAFGNVLTQAFVIKTVAFSIATVPTLMFNFFVCRSWVFRTTRGRRRRE